MTARSGRSAPARRGRSSSGAPTARVPPGSGRGARTPSRSTWASTPPSPPAPRSSPLGAAADRAARRGWSGVLAANAAAWREAWASDVRTPGSPDLQAWLRAAQYGLLANTRPGSSDSIAPAGLTSDNYAGMVFWDAETWMYPGLLATRPDLARSVVEYRYRTRAAARANAEKLGHKGLFYPGRARARAVWTPSARAGTRRTASPRTTSRATSHSPSGSTTWPPATAPGWPGGAGRC